MDGLKRHLGVAVAIACSLVFATGTALAAPPATPPGQEQKADAAATGAEQSQEAPGQLKKESAEATASAQAGAQGINSTSAGVKPSNDTAKHTSCTTGGSMPSPTCTRTPPGDNPPDSSKRYGNGMTAAQIAVSRGAAAIEIRGPGNSQPHKVCGKNGNWVDVHAVKSYAGVCAEVTATPPTRNVTPPTTSVTPPTTAVTPQTTSASGAGGVAGAQGELGSAAGEGAAGGVQGAFGVLGAAGTLPFTGFPLWAVALLGLAAIAAGLALRRRIRPELRGA